MKMTNVKYSLEQVKEVFVKSGYTLVSKEYPNAHATLETLCPKGHTYYVKFYCFKNSGNRCTECSGNKAHTYEEVKKTVEKEGYELLSTEYLNNKSKIELLCPKNHIYATTFGGFRNSKNRCSKCAGIQRLTYEEVYAFFQNRNEILITKNYVNSSQILAVLCSKGHKYDTTYNRASKRKQPQSCSICYSGPPNKKKTLNEIMKSVEKEGYSLLSENYNNMHEKIELICPNKHVYLVKMSDFVTKKSRCTQCSLHGVSKEELQILEWVREFFPDAAKKKIYYEPGNKTKHVEIDIYIPELNLGIEYNGLIWHSEYFLKKAMYKRAHEKMIEANKNGLRLITIFQDEWLHRKEQVKGFLLSVFKKRTIGIGARKTTLLMIDKKEAAKFFNENHIQGSTNTDVCFGLFYENELVGAVSGSKHHRQGHEGVFVLNRLAFKIGYSISGGASKLLKALLLYAKHRGYLKLISWSDNRWSTGDVYEKTGFALEEIHRPDYDYVCRSKRISKQSCQKRMLLKRGAVGETEREMAWSLKLYRIWNCGKKRWAINL
jgi:hypothetical protein